MFSIKDKKEALCRTITRWGSAVGTRDHARAWREIEDAILALDNAAYDRAYKQTRSNAVDWHLTAIDRAEEIERLKEQLADARSDLRILSREKDDAVDEGIRLREELADARDTIKRLASDTPSPSIQEVRKERDAARSALASATDTVRRLGDQLNQVGQVYARGAMYHAQSRGEELDRLREALEAIADRYHHELCRCCSGAKSRADCDARDGVVRKAEEALAGESEPRPSRAMMAVVEELEAAARKRPRVRISAPYAPYTDAMRREEKRADTAPEREHCCVRCRCGRRITRRCSQLLHKVYYLDECRECRVADPDIPPEPVRCRCALPELSQDTLAVHVVGFGEVIGCACGCGRERHCGEWMYRFVYGGLTALLYATRECALKADVPKPTFWQTW